VSLYSSIKVNRLSSVSLLDSPRTEKPTAAQLLGVSQPGVEVVFSVAGDFTDKIALLEKEERL